LRCSRPSQGYSTFQAETITKWHMTLPRQGQDWYNSLGVEQYPMFQITFTLAAYLNLLKWAQVKTGPEHRYFFNHLLNDYFVSDEGAMLLCPG
jgi:hypothetical protein